MNSQTHSLNPKLSHAVSAALESWDGEHNTARLWSGDPSLWTGADESSWLGWLSLTDTPGSSPRLEQLVREIRREGLSHLLLLGMGGSSLFPEILAATFGKQQGYPELHVLDSTDPAQIRSFESRVDLSRTLFIVSSKSGSTLESDILTQYFFERVKQVLGDSDAGRRFVAITDPGSKLQAIAEGEGFRSVFLGEPAVGGRYSALSNFGRVPAALMGLDVAEFIRRAGSMVQACKPQTSVHRNPGVVLGVILGTLANAGRDKPTLIASPEISGMGAWLEQLLAESTGKDGKGLIPVEGESVGPPGVYGEDRLFLHLRLDSSRDRKQEHAVRDLEESGHPVIRITMADRYDLGREVFRWEVATAVAGSILEINPFDQPDVEASKIATRDLTRRYEREGSFPRETAFFSQGGISLLADEKNRRLLSEAAGAEPTAATILQAHLGRLRPGDYFAILAYLEMSPSHRRLLQRLRRQVRDRFGVATCLGFGPRFLHSTGQAYKGGPNSGVFLQLTGEDPQDLPVPGRKYTFGAVKAAQARGDFQVLSRRGRRALRVHLSAPLEESLRQLCRIGTGCGPASRSTPP
ncbi:MAG: bifunctional transaldolase/phosoglucose isomerase [Acidobacteriota bacterium]|nr:bifunctional transaldolase/phosoglucose isomerase [Acidobacteriota bacterium]